MAKTKEVYFCQSCGGESLKWVGQCPHCQEWNSLTSATRFIGKSTKKSRSSNWSGDQSIQATKIADIQSGSETRLITPDNELNRVLGGGIVNGSMTLLAGSPGVGKSTLLLQIALQLTDRKVLYITGEESASQIKLRADRIPFKNEELYIAPETNLERAIQYYQDIEPELIIVDSIQTLHTQEVEATPGSITQIRESAARLIRLAKDAMVPIFLVGHITKEGMIAGPKVLEHMVDCVLTFEGDKHTNFRIIRTTKNRYGSTMELGIYEMLGEGLREVPNPSEIFLSRGNEQFSGVAISATMEGLRPLLIETQALVGAMAYGTPQRSSTGFDLRRLNMLLAVLEKRCGFQMGTKDVFVNITGGLKIEDPALDLALICALVSSLHDLVIPPHVVLAAEVGLSGEIRPVNRLEARIAEAAKLGFKEMYIAQRQFDKLKNTFDGFTIKGVSKLEEVFRQIFAEI